MNKIQENILGTEKIGRLLVKFAVPGIISMVVNSLYNIVDQIFIGQGVGYLGNGATNVIFPMVILAISFSMLIGDGTASYMSLKLGERQEEEASKGASAGIIGIVTIGIILGIIYVIFLEPLCRLFGSTEAILPYALDYGRIISIGIPFCAISAGFASIIRADGSPKYNMAGLLVGCIINIVLDPIFIFIFEWGVKGAALATILGQIVNTIIYLAYIPRMKNVHINKETIKNCGKTFSKVTKLGVSSFITQMVIVILIAVQNNVLTTYGAQSQYGADIPMTALGVTMKVFNIIMSIVMGLAAGAQPIWGFNYGSRQYDRVKKAFFYVVAIATVTNIIAFAIFQLAPMSIVSIFGKEDALYNEFSVKCLQVFLMLIPIGGLQMTSGIFFQAIGRPIQSSAISLSKQILFQIPAMLILARLMGVEGVLWGGVVSDALAFILTAVLLRAYWKKIFKEEK